MIIIARAQNPYGISKSGEAWNDNVYRDQGGMLQEKQS